MVVGGGSLPGWAKGVSEGWGLLNLKASSSDQTMSCQVRGGVSISFCLVLVVVGIHLVFPWCVIWFVLVTIHSMFTAASTTVFFPSPATATAKGVNS